MMDVDGGRKRKSGGVPLSAQKRGQIASIKFNKLHPWGTWGAMRVERGTPDSIGLFGETWKKANEAQRNLRKVHGFTGHGEYGKLAGLLGGYAGAAASPYLGIRRSTGRKYGSMAGRAAANVMGYGEYKLRGHSHVANNLIASTNTLSMMSQEAHTGAIVVSRSELVKDITPTAAGFQTQFSCDINPGLNEANGGCFDWLSQIAQYYEQYEFEQCLFEFKSTISPGNTSAAGTVIMTPLQVGSEDYGDKNAMSYAQGQASAGVAEHILAGVECKRGQVYAGTVKRTRTGPVDADYINYDLARFQLATQDAVANLNVGELWVHYTVRLSQPRFGSVGDGSSSSNPICDAVESLLVANILVTNLMGASATVSQIADCPDGNLGPSQYSTAKLATSANYRYYTGTSDTSGTAFAANCGFLKIAAGSNFVNRTILFSLKLRFNGTSNSATTPFSAVNLRIYPTGNASYLADSDGQYVRSTFDLSKITLAAATVVTITGLETIFQFALQFGNDDSLPTAVIMMIDDNSQNEITLSTSVNSSLFISDISNYLEWGSVQ